MNKELKRYKLSEIANILVGGDMPEKFSTGKTDFFSVPVYSNGEKNNGLYGYTDAPKITEPAVTISARGSKVGFAAIRKQPYFPIVRLLSLIPNQDKLDVMFLYYNLKLNRQNGTGSGQPQITIPDISNKTIDIPTIQTQQKIAAVLTALDEKIELNQRINAELESMAKTLYDYWFVQFDFPNEKSKRYKSAGGKMVWNEELKREIPLGWKKGTLSDLGTITGGSTPSTKVDEYFDVNGTAWITPKDLSVNVGNKFITKGETGVSEKGLKAASLTIMPKGTILLSSRAPIGYMAIARKEVTTNQGFKSFIPNKDYSTPYVYYTVKNAIPMIVYHSSGSTFKEVSGSVLKAISICLPPFSITKKYKEAVNAIFERQNKLELESQTLTELRDWLLPMLMNGQVTVEG